MVVEDALADFFGEADDETEVMGGSEAVVLRFFRGVAGTPEGAKGTERPAGAAGCAVAAGFEGLFDAGELAEIKVAVVGINLAMAGFTGGGDAVEGVSAHFGAYENIVRMGKTEEVARFVRGEFLVAPAEDCAEIFFQEGAAEAETIKLFAVDGHRAESFRGRATEVFPAAALEDAVEMLAVAEIVAMFKMLAEAALGPAFGAGHGFNIIFISVSKGSKLIESHMNIRADLALDAHGFFGADEIGLTVEGIGEVDAFFGDVGETFFVGGIGDAAFFFHGNDFAETGTERHDLETARVGDGRLMPRVVREAVLTVGTPIGEAAFGCDFGSLAAKVIAIGEHGLGAGSI